MLDNLKKPTIIALGYFDSVHLGHQKLIKSARDYAIKNGCTLTVFTFMGNLKAKLNKTDDKCVYLPMERQRLLSDLGADVIYFAPTTKTFLSMGKLAFLNDLNRRFNIKGYFTGLDYKFGKQGKGNVEYLTDYANKNNQKHIVVDTFTFNDIKISTTLVKSALSAGDIGQANALLGRNYSVTGKVIKDRKVGTLIGFPTANILLEQDKFMLKDGVYFGKVQLFNKEYKTIINYGARPTFNLKNKLIEAHIIDFNGDIYNTEITLEFLGFLREIKKFENQEELKEQLRKDLNKIKGENYD